MKIFILILILLTSATSAFAAEASTVTIKQIENYLNNITTYQASFTQIMAGSDYSKGQFYMNRPRQFLWQYETPYTHKLVSTGTGLFFEDGQNEQLTQLPLNSGLASIFTRKTFDFTTGEIMVKSLRNKNNFAEITLGLKDEFGGYADSSIVMVFKAEPMQLVQLATVDPIGGRVAMIFENIQHSKAINPDKFKVVLPFGDNW